jgi:serine protease Do
MRFTWILLIVLIAGSSLAQADELAEASRPQATTEQVGKWVAELDSNLFDDRERAQKDLTQAKAAALDAVAEAARSGSLECSTRAINILLAWSEAEDHELVLAALEKLSTMDNHPKQSLLAKELLADVRENMSLKSIEKLGGSYQLIYLPNGGLLGRQQKNVQVFIGAEWKGGLDGLKHLENVPNIYVLGYHSPPLSDDALTVLEKIPRLNRVELYGTKQMTPEAIEAAQKKLTAVTFDIRSGAFLGVQGGSITDRAQVLEVVAGSAADVAGIKQNDIITQLDGNEIKDFSTLTGLIGQHEPGDSVTLTVLRPRENALPEELDLKVTFAQWGKGGAGSKRPGFNNPIQNAIPVQEPGNLNLERR